MNLGSKKQNNPKQNSETQSVSAVVQLLLKHGVDVAVAEELVKTYRSEHIRAQVAMLPYRQPKANPAGLLIKAIRENWSEPIGYTNKKQTHRVAKDTATPDEAQQQRRDQAEQIALIKSQLTNAERKALRAEAKRNVARILRNKYGDKIPNILIEGLENHIIRVRYLNKQGEGETHDKAK